MTGGLSGKAKLALAGLAALAAAGGVTAAYKMGESKGDSAGYQRGNTQGFASGLLIGEEQGYKKGQSEAEGEIKGLQYALSALTPYSVTPSAPSYSDIYSTQQ